MEIKNNVKRVTTGAAATMLGVQRETVAKLFDTGRLTGIKLPSGHRKIDVRSVESYRRRASSRTAQP